MRQSDLFHSDHGGAGSGGSVVPFDFNPLPSRLLVAAHALMAYLWKMIVPLHLVPFYPYHYDASLLSPKYLSAVLLVAGITAFAIVRARKQKCGWRLSYYVITLIPVLGIVQVGSQAMADRYTYLPSIGPFLLAGLGRGMGLAESGYSPEARASDQGSRRSGSNPAGRFALIYDLQADRNMEERPGAVELCHREGTREELS